MFLSTSFKALTKLHKYGVPTDKHEFNDDGLSVGSSVFALQICMTNENLIEIKKEKTKRPYSSQGSFVTVLARGSFVHF